MPYSISGTVMGKGGVGATVTLAGSSWASTTADSSGNYTFSSLTNGLYLITATKTGYNFDPSNLVVGINNANVTGQDFAAAVVSLSQNTAGLPPTTSYLPVSPTSGPPAVDLSEYMLMIFQSSDWLVGRTDPTYAVAMTQMDVDGNWLSTPLVVIPGTYTIVIQNNYGTTKVIASNFEV